MGEAKRRRAAPPPAKPGPVQLLRAQRPARTPAQQAHDLKLVAMHRARLEDPVARAKLGVKTPARRAQVKRLRALWSDPIWLAAWMAKQRARRSMMFEAWLHRRVHAEPTSGCWLWLGSLTADGYGRVSRVDQHRRQEFYAHRFVYERSGHIVPPGFQLHHRCRLRSCVKPGHLQPLSLVDHARASAARRREAAPVAAEPDLDLVCLCGRTRGVFAAACCETENT